MFLHGMGSKSLGRGMYIHIFLLWTVVCEMHCISFATALTVFRCCRWSMRLGKCFGKTSLPTS